MCRLVVLFYVSSFTIYILLTKPKNNTLMGSVPGQDVASLVSKVSITKSELNVFRPLALKYDLWDIMGSIRRIGKSDMAYWSIWHIGALKYGFWKILGSIRHIGKSDTAYQSAARLIQTRFLRKTQTVMNWKSRHLSLDS